MIKEKKNKIMTLCLDLTFFFVFKNIKIMVNSHISLDMLNFACLWLRLMSEVPVFINTVGPGYIEMMENPDINNDSQYLRFIEYLCLETSANAFENVFNTISEDVARATLLSWINDNPAVQIEIEEDWVENPEFMTTFFIFREAYLAFCRDANFPILLYEYLRDNMNHVN